MNYFGRKKIYTSETSITRENLLTVLQKSVMIHKCNSSDIRYLWRYYKGDQPILNRKETKEIRPDICNIITENHASEIVAFFSGYLLGEPCSYVRRGDDTSISEKIDRLNDMMFSEDKPSCDKELATWLYVCGVGYRMCLPDKAGDEDEAPFEIETCDPRNTFVVRSTGFGKPVVIGAQAIFRDENVVGVPGNVIYCGYTDRHYFETDLSSVTVWKPHLLGGVPIFEYEANTARMGAFEPVLTMLDAINTVQSNRIDGVEQFIQSLAIAVNCQFEEGVTANEIREAGMLVLKSVGENRADFKILSEQLNQSESETLVRSMVDTIKTIVGMPNNTAGLGGGSSGNVGSVIAWQGWDLCEPRVKETELLFKRTEKQFLKLVFGILRRTKGLDLKLSDVDIKFSRRNIENLLVKTQALSTLLTSGINPEAAIATVGLWNDPMNIAAQSAEYLDKWKPAAEPMTDSNGLEGGGALA